MTVDERRELHRKMLDKLSTEEAHLAPLGRFKGVAVYGVRAAKVTDDEWKQWLVEFGKRLSGTK